MKITFFSAKPYDKESFNKQNEHFGFDLEYYETHLGPHIINAVEKTDAVLRSLHYVVQVLTMSIYKPLKQMELKFAESPPTRPRQLQSMRWQCFLP